MICCFFELFDDITLIFLSHLGEFIFFLQKDKVICIVYKILSFAHVFISVHVKHLYSIL